MFIKRYIESQLVESLQSGRVTVVLGPRRVGKTTLIKHICSTFEASTQFYNCDDPDVRATFENISLHQLKQVLGEKTLIIFDEAQRIKNIGLTLKLIVDELPEKKVLVSGSSSLELANETSEPLTGRKKTFHLFPISFLELANHEGGDHIATQAYLNASMLFGSYPKVLELSNIEEKSEYLLELSQDYLFKDALEYQDVRNPEQLRKLLTALALQIGQEVSFPEVANLVGVDQKTVMRYLDLLEKSFVIFRLPALSRNLRTEIAKSRKFYFYDLGIRNALIKNFNSYDLRTDKGQAWENLLVSERIKRNAYVRHLANYYFWRTYDQKEIDFIEESGGVLNAYEFKWKDQPVSLPGEFSDAYSASHLKLVSTNSFLDFVL